MSSILRALILVTLLAGCSLPSGNVNAPRNLDNACSILDQRRSFFPAFMAAKRKYGVPVSVQMAIIWQESKFKSKAKTPRRYRFGLIPVGRQSSAYGYAQVLDGTWKEYKAKAGRWNASRTNIRDSADFMGWYMTQSRRKLGISMSDTRNQYLAYHEGRTGYRRGSYKSKRWLLRVAKNLENRAQMYNNQLRRCRKT
jgi:hypothetical protein